MGCVWVWGAGCNFTGCSQWPRCKIGTLLTFKQNFEGDEGPVVWPFGGIEFSKQREQPVQRSWGRTMSQVSEEQPGGPCGWSS